MTIFIVTDLKMGLTMMVEKKSRSNLSFNIIPRLLAKSVISTGYEIQDGVNYVKLQTVNVCDEAVFNEDEAKIALKKEGAYRSSINLWWLDPFGSATPTVPLSKQRVQELGAFAFPDYKPAHLADSFCVAVDAPDADLQALKGRWRPVSPEEMHHCIIFTLAAAIDSGKASG